MASTEQPSNILWQQLEVVVPLKWAGADIREVQFMNISLYPFPSTVVAGRLGAAIRAVQPLNICRYAPVFTSLAGNSGARVNDVQPSNMDL